MGKVETIIKSEIVRLARREMRKNALPLGREVRALRSRVSQLRKTVLDLQRSAARQDKETGKEKIHLEAAPEEVKGSRFSPRLIRSLRKRLGVTQKELATLAKVTVGAIYQWEKGIFEPRGEKKGLLVALRKLGRRDVKGLLKERSAEKTEKKAPKGRRGKRGRRSRKR
jgi:DNA-binding transcriptional regulator YiaG